MQTFAPSAQSQAFENLTGSGHDVDLDKLAKSARESFGMLEKWQKQKSFDHPLVEVVIKKIVLQGPDYYLAIQKSAETAAKGCSFASDAIAFCQRLIENRANDSVEALSRGLQDIQLIAKTAHEGSKDMNNRFRSVRKGLFQITKEIPTHVKSVTSQHTKDAALEDDEVLTHLVILDPPAERSATTSKEVTLSSEELAKRKELLAVLTRFQRVTEDLGALIQQVAYFVDWWNDINLGLASLETILPQIRVDGSNPFRTETVKERWEEIYNQYALYNVEISAIEDYYKDFSGDPAWKEARRQSLQAKEHENGQGGLRDAPKTGVLKSINEQDEAGKGTDLDIGEVQGEGAVDTVTPFIVEEAIVPKKSFWSSCCVIM